MEEMLILPAMLPGAGRPFVTAVGWKRKTVEDLECVSVIVKGR